MKQDSLYQEIYTDLKTAIHSMADGLGIAAEHVYEVLVMQQIVKACIFSSLILVGTILMIFAVKQTFKVKDWEEPTVKGVLWIIFLIVSGIMVGIGLGHLEIIMTGFINPEYGAIKDIMSFVK